MSAARTFVGRQDRSRQSFESDSATEKVAAQIGLRGADPVQLRAQETEKVAKIHIVVQRDPLGVDEGVR